jgi:hypothetical protein
MWKLDIITDFLAKKMPTQKAQIEKALTCPQVYLRK